MLTVASVKPKPSVTHFTLATILPPPKASREAVSGFPVTGTLTPTSVNCGGKVDENGERKKKEEGGERRVEGEEGGRGGRGGGEEGTGRRKK